MGFIPEPQINGSGMVSEIIFFMFHSFITHPSILTLIKCYIDLV